MEHDQWLAFAQCVELLAERTVKQVERSKTLETHAIALLIEADQRLSRSHQLAATRRYEAAPRRHSARPRISL
jgi:hypothetical protein